MPKKKVSAKQVRKDAILDLFSPSLEVMKAVLKDELKDKRGVKVKVTGKMRLDVALRVMDQTVGRAPQAITTGGDEDKVPIRTLEVRKSYTDPIKPEPEEKADPNLMPAAEVERSRAQIMAEIEAEDEAAMVEA
jgi:hypothetical protein